MGIDEYPARIQSAIPAACFNTVSRARRSAGGYLQLNLIGLSDNIIYLSGSEWRCWNRPLQRLLLSWREFHRANGTCLHEDVACAMTVHDPYARTIVYSLFDALRETAARELEYGRDEQRGLLLAFPRSA